ncbi:TetR/AcrR family transcriptional regulator [Candidatus Desantisbacteria bacterium]|nr:TetR/AcrR family transcriptional regulator [Candidatus Desantisbacteria bacterium]
MQLVIEKSKEKTLLPKIMKAAIKLFNKKGITGTTTKEIAEKAGVAEGALYRHFKGKDELAWYIFTENLNKFSINLQNCVEHKKTAKDKIKVLVSTSLASYEKDKELFTYLLISEHRELNKFPENYMHPGHVVLKIIEEGQKTGELKKMNLYVAGSILMGSLIRFCAIRMYGTVNDDLCNYEDEIFTGIWRAIKND